MTRTNTSPMAPRSEPLLTRGFCVDRAGEQRLIDADIAPRSIWMRGRGAETMDECLRSFRGRQGRLAVANDLTIFGQTRKDIMGVMKALFTGGISILDVVSGETNPHELEHQALKHLSSKNGACDRRTARKRGARGGTAKGIASAERRNAIMREDIVRKLVGEIGVKRLARIMGPPFSASTLNRIYRGNI